jgi:hypothetical protein
MLEIYPGQTVSSSEPRRLMDALQAPPSWQETDQPAITRTFAGEGPGHVSLSPGSPNAPRRRQRAAQKPRSKRYAERSVNCSQRLSLEGAAMPIVNDLRVISSSWQHFDRLRLFGVRSDVPASRQELSDGAALPVAAH